MLVYDLDLNAGLTEVLAAQDEDFLYGLGKTPVAQNDPGDIEYLLNDSLGSVRQVVRGDSYGQVTLTRSYDPFGSLLTSVGNGTSAFGYAGQWKDASGLMDMRARYYDPTDGRFLTEDTWQGDSNTPMSYNSWLYVYANPVNNIDSTGYFPNSQSENNTTINVPDKRDLTDWLPGAAVYMARSPEIQEIRKLNSPDDCSIWDKIKALTEFFNVVHAGAKFDVKIKIKSQLGDVVKLGPRWYEYSTPGNFVFGFYGTEAGFGGEILHQGAGGAQLWDLLRYLWNGDPTDPVTIGGPDIAFDTSDDYYATQLGISLYNKYYAITNTFTKDNFVEGLLAYPFAPDLAERDDPGNYRPNTQGPYSPDVFDQ